jgi:hypothetical protein
VADAVGLEESDELLNGVGGVADGVEDVGRHRSIVVPIRWNVLGLKSRFFVHHPEPIPTSLRLFGAPGAFGGPFSQNDTVVCGGAFWTAIIDRRLLD